MNAGKRRKIGWLGLLLAAVGALTVTAQSAAGTVTEKTVTLSLVNGAGLLSQAPATAAVWEYPALSAGETAPEGTLRLCNTTTYTARIALAAVELPYTDEAALRYLNTVYLTVWDGDTILYEGSYAHAADAAGGLRLSAELQAGESKSYRVGVRRAFAGGEDASPQIAWQFTSTLSYTEMPAEESGVPWGWLAGIAGMLAVSVLIGWLRRRRQRKQG